MTNDIPDTPANDVYFCERIHKAILDGFGEKDSFTLADEIETMTQEYVKQALASQLDRLMEQKEIYVKDAHTGHIGVPVSAIEEERKKL